jgi:hypothetical protein
LAITIKREMIGQMNAENEVRYTIIVDVDGSIMPFSEAIADAVAGPDAEIARARNVCVDAATAAGLA